MFSPLLNEQFLFNPMQRRVPCIADIMQVEAEVRALSILSQNSSNSLDDSTCVSVGKANVIKIYEVRLCVI